ncbi:hypothetical protein IJG28_02765 [Candidatus Saccharibacteria bacterium]|nr:hypothetical protein [Candidatus Saccharibacteria bacterium]
MSAEKKKQLGVLWLIVVLVVVLIGSVVFVGAVSGWFDDTRVTVDDEYICVDDCGELMELTAEEYGRLIEEKKSFVVFVDQGGCTTADKLREYVRDWSEKSGVRVYRMMFKDMKDSLLAGFVKYYPSVALVSRGKVVTWLRADSDEDADIYNDYDVFSDWMKDHIVQ